MKMDEYAIKNYHEYLDETYPHPRSARRFQDIVYEIRNLEKIFDLIFLYSKPIKGKSIDLVLMGVMFGYPEDLEKVYDFVMSKPEPPKDLSGIIDDCVRHHIPLRWSTETFNKYFGIL